MAIMLIPHGCNSLTSVPDAIFTDFIILVIILIHIPELLTSCV